MRYLYENVLIISSSPRKNGNSEILANSFKEGALYSKNNVELVNLRDLKINYCFGCNACSTLGECIQKDDVNELMKKLLKCDVLVLATPTYFYNMSGQLKVMIDRMTACYTKIKADIYIIVSGWDNDSGNLEKVVNSIRGFTKDCLENCPEKGVIKVGGFVETGDISNTRFVKQAFEFGKNC